MCKGQQTSGKIFVENASETVITLRDSNELSDFN